MKIWLPEELKFLTNGSLPQAKSVISSKGKIVIISGSTSGVGKAALYEFAKQEAHLVMVIRNKDKADKLIQEVQSQYDVNIDVIICDFSDFDSVRNAAKQIIEKYEKIDILINSVGIHTTRKIYTKDGIEMSFMVNHLSVFLFTVLLIPKLKENEQSRIIQVNSEGHRFNGLRIKDVNFRRRIYTGLKGYGQSKVAQLYTMYELSKRLKGTNVTINAMHPGAVKSGIGSNNGFLYRMWYKLVTQRFLKDSKISGDALYYLATSKELENVSGKFFNLTILEKPAWHAVKKHKQKPIWDLSLKMCNLPHDLEV